MDKATRLILAIAVLVIFPTLVIIGAVQFINFADAEKPTAPQYPNSTNPRPDCFYTETQSTRNNTTNKLLGLDQSDEYSNCLTKQAEYDKQIQEERNKYEQAMNAYQEQYKEYDFLKNKEISLQAIAILVVSILSLAIGYKIREIKELAGSLVVASSLMITGTTITLTSQIKQDIYPKISNILTLLSFIVVVYIMYLIEKTAFANNNVLAEEYNKTNAAIAAQNIIAKEGETTAPVNEKTAIQVNGSAPPTTISENEDNNTFTNNNTP